MATALRISEAATLGLHAMALIGASSARLTTGAMAERLGVSEAHLAKVLQRLSHAGLVRSVRGPGGGSALAEGCGKVSFLQVYEAIDGPLGDATCLLSTPACGGNCLLGNLLEEVNDLVRDRLSRITVRTGPDTAGEKGVS